ncbi:hypothetical protein KUTeg_004110 [Tegillarca granosa]|uniref:Amine oxidase domain-containing protein n=1 Tax=Tegillarca granosa TaxID=220873 RepID=A0ABQ9FP15_TEGGR|nr:hypothetical protein KUTeg_004110 [Tegillarca granosa]
MNRVLKEKSEIIIIGAGAAGISAAHHLYSNGFRNLRILEASDRIGGRINTITFGHDDNSMVELGANYIHGADEKNSMFKLAESRGMLDSFVLYDRIEGLFYSEDGRLLDKELVKQANKLFEVANCELDTFYEKEAKRELNCLDYMNTRLKELLNTFAKTEREDVESIFNCLLNHLSFTCGDDLSKCSLYLMGVFKDIEERNVKLPFGYIGVLRSLLKDIHENIVHLNKEVTTIQWQKDSSDKTVTVLCNNGKKRYTADHVIVTLPLGVLKDKHSTLFSPTIPERKANAIMTMGFGIVNKIFLYFDQPFWKSGKGGIKLVWSGDNSFVTKETWFKHLFAFDEVLNNPNVLCAWIYGDAAKILESVPDEDVLDTCYKLICQRLNNNISRPIKLARSSWFNFPYTRGSYSYLHTESNGDEPDIIGEPLQNGCDVPVILFAGEATHHKWFSTTHGARDSGIREAQRLINYYRN